MTNRQNPPLRAEGLEKLGKLTLASYPDILDVLADIYSAVARTNAELGVLKSEKASAIEKASQSLRKEKIPAQTPIYGILGRPFYRNFALELAKKATSPTLSVSLDDLERNCATADITATLLNCIALRMLRKNIDAARKTAQALHAKAQEFGTIVKCARSSLQDGFPIFLAEDFHARACGFERIAGRLEKALDEFCVSLLGFGDEGTALDTDDGFIKAAATQLSAVTGFPFVSSRNPMDGLAAVDSLIYAHGLIKSLAVHYWKTMHDFVLMTSGPRGGIREIALPAVAPGSSIMPGKVNPTMAQLGALIADGVASADTAATAGAMSGWFSEGMRQSTVVKALLDSGNLLERVMLKNIEKLISGIAAQPNYSEREAAHSQALLLVVQKVLGPDVADRLHARIQKEPLTVREALKKEALLTDERIQTLTDLKTLATPGENTRMIRHLRTLISKEKP